MSEAGLKQKVEELEERIEKLEKKLEIHKTLDRHGEPTIMGRS